MTCVRAGLAALLLLAAQSALAQSSGFAAEGTAFQAVLLPADGKTVLYLADADSNAPTVGALVEAEAGGWQGVAQASHAGGVYELAWMPPAEGADVTLIVSGGGRDDLLLIQGVRPPPLPGPPAAAPLIAHWTHWAGGGAIGAVLVTMVLLGRRRKAAAAVLVMLAAAAPAFAHGGEDHGAPAQSSATTPLQPGQPIPMSKPTQFLLGIRTETIEPREAADTVRVVGRVIPDPSGYARVQPSQPARIVSDPNFPIPVPGQQVKRGQVLAVLEPTLTNLERGDKRSSLSRIESQLAITERDLARQEALGGVVPVKQVETTRIQLDQLRRERAQIAGTALGRELLLAPVDGVITDVHVVPGEVVGPTQALVEVVDPARLRVEAVIHDLLLARRVAGAQAVTRLLPGEIFPLTLLGVSPRMDLQDQGVHAVFRVEGGQAVNLSIGMPVDVFLATGATRLRTAVPRDAIAEMGGRQVVFVRTAPELFEARPVKVERIVGPLAEISEGVKPGDRVVTQGIEQLRAGR
ncbi:MAG: efflux RND transporter periplasmic adaptor subunit [Phaeospirillum sp.]|nr:efflux RND transporter periplasmic adaptor subunit [Phaeospirillum sp.]